MARAGAKFVSRGVRRIPPQTIGAPYKSLGHLVGNWSAPLQSSYDFDEMFAKERGPGIAKVRTPPLVQRRDVRLVAPLEGRWRELVENADVVSEGVCRDEARGRTYYGTTSLLLLARAEGGGLPDGDLECLARIVGTDPHLRLRAVRIAYREAASRASAPLEPVHAELSVTCGSRGLILAVDVVAAVVAPPGRRAGRTRR